MVSIQFEMYTETMKPTAVVRELEVVLTSHRAHIYLSLDMDFQTDDISFQALLNCTKETSIRDRFFLLNSIQLVPIDT